MSDYIERQSAIDILHYNWDEPCTSAIRDIEKIPSADVAMLVHGKWIRNRKIYSSKNGLAEMNSGTQYKCSICGRRTGYKQVKRYRFCPSCGAEMNLED